MSNNKALIELFANFAEVINGESGIYKGNKYHLSILQQRILDLIYRSEKPIRQTDIATAVHITRPSATVIIDRLEVEGLVRRKLYPADRRAVLVNLTAKGRRIIQHATDDMDTILSAAIAGFSDQDVATVRKFFEQFISTITT